ncbi:uncharacterized protein LOC112126965 [Cimex lectularius]|uniref:Uncharacterized protein n=1 Tax=Cimex lectularius TaxID=79782 RepID=A0A8I6SKF3_CIMLE|nr:uncharacterized protein LOC112126965 [Cimex lectularius]
MVVSQFWFMVGLSAWGMFSSYKFYKNHKEEQEELERKARQKEQYGVQIDLSRIQTVCSGVCIRADPNADVEMQANQIEEQKQMHYRNLVHSLSTAIMRETLQDGEELD